MLRRYERKRMQRTQKLDSSKVIKGKKNAWKNVNIRLLSSLCFTLRTARVAQTQLLQGYSRIKSRSCTRAALPILSRFDFDIISRGFVPFRLK